MARMPLFLAGLVSLMIPAAGTLAARHHRTQATPAPAAPVQPVSYDQAARIVLDRPEVRELADRVATGSHHAVRLAIMHEGQRPHTLGGQRFWVLGVYESRATRMPRVGTLLVRVRDGQVFAKDNASNRVISLRQWSAHERLTYRGEAVARPAVKKTSHRPVPHEAAATQTRREALTGRG